MFCVLCLFHLFVIISFLLTSSNVPLLSSTGSSTLSIPRSGSLLQRSSSALLRDVDALNKFLDALFNFRVLEARKYFPAVTLSLRANTTIHVFVPELVNRLLKRGSFLTSEQFEILVRVLNIVLTNEKVAIQVLPLTTVFYQVRTLCTVYYYSPSCSFYSFFHCVCV